MSDGTWTDKPDGPGAYWYTEDGFDPQLPALVEVMEDNKRLLAHAWGTMFNERPCIELTGQWMKQPTPAQWPAAMAAVEALRDLMRRLDSHFGGVADNDWKEQEQSRAALAAFDAAAKGSQ